MTRFVRLLLAAIVAVATIAPLQAAQAGEAPYTQAELDQMLAPIALYPDALLSQVLLAATRPLEVVEAARWSRANPGLQGDDAVRAAQEENWDPSVKSLVAFPQLLARMDENLDWTKALGDAFFVQEPVVMETVQELRRRARAAGQLMTDERLRVYDEGQAIVIESATPELVYVPYYDPWIVYGPWWWSAYPPVAWGPWPGYGFAPRPGATAGYWWGPAIGVSLGFITGSVDWSHRRVYARPHRGYSRPHDLQRDPRRIAPRAEQPRPRRERRPEAFAPRAAQHAPQSQPAQRQRFERGSQVQPQPAQAVTTQVPVPRPQRVERAPRMQPQPAQATRAQPPAPRPQAQPRRIDRAPQLHAQPPHAPRAQAPAPQRAAPARRLEPPSRAAPARADSAPQRDGPGTRERSTPGIARP
ncbi:MAG: DUF3300 domain-containing protein [Betaproteobacteria bacterium]|nr:MAG: DUF3300 domain-containing protein [Betaproteobacteria bacterium]